MAAAAYCDVDGTLTATTIVTPMVWYRRKRGSVADMLWIASLPVRGPWWLLLDRLNRGASNKAIYSNYEGFDAQWMRDNAQACFEECLKPRFFSKALERIEALKSSGVRPVLVTGSLDFIMQPLADFLGAELIAPGLLERNGFFTGELDREPLTGNAKYVAICKHACSHSGEKKIDLSASFAMGDAHGDLEMLHAVGHPIACNPDGRLKKIALEKKWEIAQWK